MLMDPNGSAENPNSRPGESHTGASVGHGRGALAIFRVKGLPFETRDTTALFPRLSM